MNFASNQNFGWYTGMAGEWNKKSMDEQLCEALEGSADKFRELLEQCEGRDFFHFIELRKGGCVVNGNLLVLAAARNCPEHMKILLEKGWDCNSTSLTANQNSCWSYVPPMGWGGCKFRPSGQHSGKGTVNYCVDQMSGEVIIAGCTPLAAAIFSGSDQAVRILKDWSGVYKEESAAVSLAAALASSQEQIECVNLAFGAGDAEFDEQDVFSRVKFIPEVFAPACSAKKLKDQITAGLYSEEDVRSALRALGEEEIARWQSPYQKIVEWSQKILLLAKNYPEVCKAEWAKGVLLKATVAAAVYDFPYEELLQCWKDLSEGVGDISWMPRCIAHMSYARFKSFFTELKQDMHLVLNADGEYCFMSVSMLNLILRNVQVQPSIWREGISGLAVAVLTSNSIRLAKTVEETGVLAAEPTEAMLKFTKQSRCGDSVRVQILMGKYGGMKQVEQQTSRETVLEYCSNGLLYHWFGDVQSHCDAYKICDRIEQMLSEADLSEEGRILQYFCRLGVWSGYNVHEIEELLIKASCAAAPNLLEKLVGYVPALAYCKNWLDRRLTFGKTDREMYLQGTPLCWAAAAGRTEQVKLLLEKNRSADEIDRGVYSEIKVTVMDPSNDGAQSVWPRTYTLNTTPLLTALICGQEETARLLIEAGAKVDFQEYAVKRLVELLFTPESKALAKKLFAVEL